MIYQEKKDFLKALPDGRIIALDMGTKKIGIAITDEKRSIAMPSETIINRGNKQSILDISQICKNKKIVGIVIGLPISFDEHDTTFSKFVKVFAESLSHATLLPIIFHDERLSSFEAEDLIKNNCKSRNLDKKLVDKIAASYILESFLIR